MGAVVSARDALRNLKARSASYLFNADPLAAGANAGALLVWSSQPTYPIYVALLVGRQFWPSLLTWFSTPLFFCVPLVGRTHPLGSRALFVLAGIFNTLLSAKAFGSASGVGWFLVPCLIIATTFFRWSEWKFAGGLALLCAVAALLVRHAGAPLHTYSVADYRALTRLNMWSAAILSAYLIFVGVRARRAAPERKPHEHS